MIELTARQHACLYWASQGKTSWEIGQILGISERTVNFHFSKLYDMMDVHTRQAAIAVALQYRLLDLSQAPAIKTSARYIQAENRPGQLG